MYRVVLIFGDTKDLASFLLTHEMSGIETNTRELTLAGILTKDQIDIACKKYGAYVRVYTELFSEE